MNERMNECEAPCCSAHEEMQRAVNQLFFGTPERPAPGKPGKPTAVRAVICVASLEAIDAETLAARPYGVAAAHVTRDQPEHSREMVRILRQLADDLEFRYSRPEAQA